MDTLITFTHLPLTPPSHSWPHRETGTCLDFFGIVRETENQTAIPGLHYEAYEPMARKILSQHFLHLHSLYPIHAVHFIHRLGWVPVNEASLFLRVTSSHRQQAFLFLSHAIDLLKTDVPIWKSLHPPSPTFPDKMDSPSPSTNHHP